MYRLRLLISAAGTLALIAACGNSVPPDRVTPELRSLLQAERTIVSCAPGSSGTPPPSPGASCVPRQSVIASLAPSDDGQRLAVLYLDGHVAVWDLGHHSLLLRLPPAPTQQIWLTGGGRILAREVGALGSAGNLLQIWPVGRRPAAQRPEAEFRGTADWVWEDPQARRMLILPQPPLRAGRGAPQLVFYDFLHKRVIATAETPNVTMNGFSQGRIIAADGVSFNKATGTFVISSEAHSGFITWKPGSPPVATNAHCNGNSEGTLSNDGRLFACFTGWPTQTLSVWNVIQRRLVTQWRPSGIASVNPYWVTFADGGRMLAVAEGRHPPEPYVIRIYQVSDHRLLRSLQLRSAPNEFYIGPLWVVGRSLVAEQAPGKLNCGSMTGNLVCTSRFFVFSLAWAT